MMENDDVIKYFRAALEGTLNNDNELFKGLSYGDARKLLEKIDRLESESLKKLKK